jgi:hypothetical protein
MELSLANFLEPLRSQGNGVRSGRPQMPAHKPVMQSDEAGRAAAANA